MVAYDKIKQDIIDSIKRTPSLSKLGKFEETYIYYDSEGKKWLQSKLKIKDSNHKKTFRMITPDSLRSGVLSGYQTASGKHLIYNQQLIPKAANDEIIYITEGEKDADSLVSLGLKAIGTSGANSHDKLDYSILSSELNYVLLPDFDEPGIEHMQGIYWQLKSHGIDPSNISAIDPKSYQLRPSGDITDYINANKIETASELEKHLDLMKRLKLLKAKPITSDTRLKATKLSSIKAKLKTYVDEDCFFPRSELILIVGKSGAGKSTNVNHIVSQISNDKSILIYTTEENPNVILKPSMVAANANLDNIHILEGTYSGNDESFFDPASHLAELRDYCIRHNISVLVLDPLRNFITEKEDTQTVGKHLAPIIAMAKELDIAIIGIHHTGKLSHFKVGDWQQLLVGSVHWYSIPRTIYYAHKFEDGRRVFTCIKSDIKSAGGGYEYDITSHEIEIDGQTLDARVLDRGKSLEGVSAEEIFAELSDTPSKQPEKSNIAIEFLKEHFEAGEVRPAKKMTEIASQPPYEISKPTMNRALIKLGFKSRKNLPNEKGKPNSAFSWQAPSDFIGAFNNDTTK